MSEQPATGRPEAKPPISMMTAVAKMTAMEMDFPGLHFEIDKAHAPITAGDLRTIMNLPYEVALYEDGGKTTLVRGDENDVPGTRNASNENTRWILHTHPFGSENTTLSPFDVLGTWRHDHQQTTHMLVTQNGVLTYRAPQHEPGRADEPIDDIFQTMGDWGKDRGAPSIFRGPAGRSNEECMAEIDRFMHDTGMVVSEASWENHAGIEQALNIINKNGTQAIGDVAVAAAHQIVEAPGKNPA